MGVYKQNPKKLNDYYETIFAADKFMLCSNDDRERREIIKQLMCNNYVIFNPQKYSAEFKMMQSFMNDKLLNWSYPDLTDPELVAIELTELGRYFVRNIASVFDTYVRSENAHKIFSKAL